MKQHQAYRHVNRNEALLSLVCKNKRYDFNKKTAPFGHHA